MEMLVDDPFELYVWRKCR